ncbi:hypothetical protein F442_18908 [Phytophthora nicotianae P10297]|uniref:Uncharacterized protein n=1 Tax=Phytophthora nicotianae P10297 TaxID=1317064 RepID=W2YCA7_PHYNI|nr:hypothetical protein F442_18908 [Phytophthora nicotianae P10297]
MAAPRHVCHKPTSTANVDGRGRTCGERWTCGLLLAEYIGLRDYCGLGGGASGCVERVWPPVFGVRVTSTPQNWSSNAVIKWEYEMVYYSKVCADYKCLRTHASASVQDTGSARDEPTMPILPTIIARVGEATRLTGFTVHRVPVRGSTMASTWRMYAEGHCWLRAAVMVLLHY